ncbi:unnamed protein product [Candida verbasci]|uniref:Dephospho-CoA kinase n=1 Tax=Candida verbasci TaxID=1227364 RepID=A0A9W4XI62_9ASCO|nr:unnamed protein product [Candida verbasci]
MLIVGLTGGIACGKSTVSNELKKCNSVVIDADLIAREVVYPNTNAYNKIVANFGNDVPNLLNDDKTLNRTALGEYVFKDKARVRILNSIVHPAVKYEIFKRIIKAYLTLEKLVILDVPLLFESGLYLICGSIINVSCTRELQIERLLKRNTELSESDAIDRINNQMSNDEKNYRSDYIIDNSGDINDLEVSVENVIREVRPGVFWYLIDLFPPFAIASALFTFTIRRIIDKFKGTKPKLD